MTRSPRACRSGSREGLAAPTSQLAVKLVPTRPHRLVRFGRAKVSVSCFAPSASSKRPVTFADPALAARDRGQRAIIRIAEAGEFSVSLPDAPDATQVPFSPVAAAAEPAEPPQRTRPPGTGRSNQPRFLKYASISAAATSSVPSPRRRTSPVGDVLDLEPEVLAEEAGQPR